MGVSETCRAVIFGCSGLILTPEEEEFFASVNPVGFILFARNIEDPSQVRALTGALRRCVGRPDAPVLIDQEGGRVQRMGPPHWPAYPTMRTFGDAWQSDPAEAERMLQDSITRMSRDLVDVGINVNCAPVLDIPQPDASDVIGLRAFSTERDVVARFASVAVDAFLRNGIVPVVKHIPGHGRARVDSHFDLPVVDADLNTLESFDFVPFRAVADAPVGMVAHIVYTAIDPENPATLSGKSFATIRERIGFKGVLLSDDISMHALSGSYENRAHRSLNAGCDTILHCNGDMEEMRAVVKGTSLLRPESLLRWQAALSAPIRSSVTPIVTEI
ncbi:beta-N-acetylhexosaminidase [Haematospirillum jordaniae]|uniref:beta-N-acetylhexosaminidase n=1 Tax=Haematospirillum jordaniae TaxID=1549855 RepID=A0A143DFB0_9PROT|nr:beta-N-acetylhexosaminidase [Haematospirillum jordaniae]AMW35210.1 hypothetical protein AY555_08530 [Haematospirillum jordaniae]NKD45637.1 beta-N-acetylhexosaminidase [Haematospirillum jordaniae]NKD56390.1 beta-N-acetylhexosaminidase [Haematospirillum jordaniae]NKD58448.1 beta-N-acetylhexosaminidase [Haematospirillum jordaniae]NKD66383.1 beta-N-acetylhexosaminidase [Haematospirillum jordaniae]